MFWVSWAKRGGKIFGTKINIYTDKEAGRYREYINYARLPVKLQEFSAGAILAFFVGLGIGFIFSGLMMAFLNVSFINEYGVLDMTPIFAMLFVSIIVATILFIIFRSAPSIAYRAAVTDIERNLLYFMPFLKGAAASGVPLEKIIEIGANIPFGQLSVEFGKIVGRNMRIRDLSKCLLMSAREIDSDFFRRAMIHIVRIREMGIVTEKKKRPEDQPIAVAMSALTKEEIDDFRRRCSSFTARISPIMDLATIICIIFPVLLIVISVVSSMMTAAGGAMIPLPLLKIMVGAIFPLVTFLLIFALTRGEPK